MNLYLQPHGFLGTGASLLADVTLIVYIFLLVPGMLVGFLYARRGKFRPNHKYTMMTITTINWVLIIFLMLAAYSYDVIGNIGQKTGEPRYLVPTIHGVLGLVAQILATFVIYRMLREERQVKAAKARGEPKEVYSRYYFSTAKYFMRTILSLWLITSLLGIFNYLIRYDILPTFASGGGVPAATQEPFVTQETSVTQEPQSTPEPARTVEPLVTDEPAAIPKPMTTEEPLATAEVTP